MSGSAAAPLRRGRVKRHYWLRTAKLNAVGWAALLGGCFVAAAVGVAAAWAIAVPLWWGAVLGVIPLVAVFLLDRRRWAAMETGFGWGGSVPEVTRIASELAALGVVVQVRPEPPTERWHEPPYEGGVREEVHMDPALQTASLSYRNRDTKTVASTLRAHDLPFPEFP
jgi:hypothetical protein